jgi:hypothetical protein
MNIFCKGFKFNQNSFLRQFEVEKTWQLHIPENLRKEIDIWEKMIIDAIDGQKIPEIIKVHLLYVKSSSAMQQDQKSRGLCKMDIM